MSLLNKCGVEKISSINILIPIKANREFDVEKQKEIAEKYKKIKIIKEKLKEDYEHLINSKVEIID